MSDGKLREIQRSAKARFTILLMLGSFSGFLLAARAQEAATSEPVELGIIVTASQGEADGVLQRLKAGFDFGVLAKEKSIDPSAKNGGYMGSMIPAQLRPELRDAVKALKAGQLTGVIRMPAGYAVATIFSTRPNREDLNEQYLLAQASTVPARHSLDVGGPTEADSVLRDYPKADGWDLDFQQVCELRKRSYNSAVSLMQQVLAQAHAEHREVSEPARILQGHAALAMLYSYAGNMEGAIQQLSTGYEIAQARVPEAVPYIEEALGTVYLHLSDMENGAYRSPGNQDIFPPLNLGAHYPKQDEARLAIEYFSKYLARKPDDLQIRWLLNLAYASVGEYPDKVPAVQRMPLSAFQSAEDIGRFRDVASAAGLNAFIGAGAVVAEDFENNGLLDIIASSVDECESLHYFHNNGDGTFSDRTAQAGLSGQLGGLNVVEGDYNNDGCIDFLVLRGGWSFGVRRSLLRNNCDGTFTDVTMQSGLGDTVTASQTAVWADIDNDGFLDLFMGNENTPSQLFRNRGDGTFEDISHSAGIDATAFSKAVAAADYDNDGYVDFYVSNANGANFLYHNNHDRTFTEIGLQAGVQAPFFSFATWFFDYDNDGWPDLFVTGYSNSFDEVMRSYLGLPHQADTLKLYRNLHNGTFQDVTAQVGLDKVFVPMGANFGDVDNDGFLDIYLGSGQASLASVAPHVLLRNHEGERFTDITASSGTGELHKGHGIAFADFGRRGFEDIVSNNGGAVPADKHALRLFENPGNDNDWINLRLVGVKSNRGAVGAQIKVTVENDGKGTRSIYRTVGETSSFGSHPLEQHIGLGHGARITSLEVRWPASDTRQHFSSVEKNQFILIKEFADTYTKLERQAVRVGGGQPAVAAK